MRLPLTTLEIFHAIACEGSFRGAAKRLGLQPSTVSHQLKTLEDRLGVSLFSRSTRVISLTEAGHALYRGAGPAFDQLEAALQSARDTARSQRGVLRITMPGFAYDWIIADKLPEFRQAYPHIELEISINETFIDLFEQQFHAGIRLGDRIDPDMIGVRISSPMSVAVLASKYYIDRYGAPETPQDLLDHECIRYRFGQSQRIAPWQFIGPEGRYSVDVRGKLIVNNLPTLFSQISAGLGLGYVLADYRPFNLNIENLVVLLKKFTEPLPGAYLYYPREYKSVELLRLFIEHFRWAGK